MNPPRVFISFSSRDLKYVRELMSGLSSQNILFWDYSDMLQAIELGKNIPKVLRQEIDKSEYFIPVISKNSVDPDIGKFTYMEVEYALSKGFRERDKLVPVLIVEEKPQKLEGSYSIFEETCYDEIYFQDIRDFEEALAKICRKLGVTYVPLIEAHPRLPFWKFFRDEVFELAHSRSAHVELMTIVGVFNKKFQTQAWEEALFLITHFIYSCQYQIPDYQLFYPWIVKAVCEHLLNRLDDAEKSYREAGKVRSRDPSVYGGLGSIYLAREDYANAKLNYKKALSYCPPDRNTDEKINYAVALIEAGEGVPADLAKFLLQLDPSTYYEDKFKIMNLQGSLYYLSKNYSRAISIFEEMQRENIHNTATIIYHYHSLLALGATERAHELLREILRRDGAKGTVNELAIYQLLSELYLKTGRIDDAIKIYQNHLLTPQQVTRQNTIKYARIYKHRGEFRKMREICQQVLDGKLFPLPKTQADFYYDGFAHYLLGNMERARYDFERSLNFDSFYSEYEK